MKCIHCGTDSKYKDRGNGRCPRCSKEVRVRAARTATASPTWLSSRAIDAVSAQGQIRWGVEHLFYELCRRLTRRRGIRAAIVAVLIARFGLAVLGVLGSCYLAGSGQPAAILVLLPAWLGLWWLVRKIYAG